MSETREVCACGHDKTAHIYHEGACRPGFACPRGCEKFTPIAPRPSAPPPPAVSEARAEAEREFALTYSAGAHEDFGALPNDCHVAFERIWQLAQGSAFTEARRVVEGAIRKAMAPDDQNTAKVNDAMDLVEPIFLNAITAALAGLTTTETGR